MFKERQLLNNFASEHNVVIVKINVLPFNNMCVIMCQPNHQTDLECTGIF